MFKLFKNSKNSKRAEKEKVTYFTSESVSPGHPDKLSDVIADTIKDFILEHDHNAHIAVEVAVTTNFILLMGEVKTTLVKVPYVSLAKQAIKKVGYIHSDCNFSVKTVRVLNKIHSQSEDINMGTKEDVGGAGDQGMQFGYACNESTDFIPLTWKIARALTSRAFAIQKNSNGSVLRPDSKAQVTAKYVDGKFDSIDTIVVACSHVAGIPQEKIKEYIKINVIQPVLAEFGYDLNKVPYVHINGTGQFAIYGPDGDSGLTGRKLVVDLYGGHACTGGGTLQGKDPSKVDNSATLMARFIAKNIVAAGLADKCQVQLAYCIGIAQPVSVNINAFGTEHCDLQKVEEFILNNVDCSPNAIISRFDLKKKEACWKYADCGAFGYMGDDQLSFVEHITYPWEELSLKSTLLKFKK